MHAGVLEEAERQKLAIQVEEVGDTFALEHNWLFFRHYFDP